MELNYLFNVLLAGWIIMAVAVFVFLLFVNAPYGRHARGSWGPVVSDRLGWIVMEAPAALVFALYFIRGTAPRTAVSWVFLGMWEAHYIQRAFIYPLTMRGTGRRMAILVAGMGLFYNTVNACFSGFYLFTLSGGYSLGWLSDPRFILGAGLFLAGYVVNRQSDTMLRALRRPGESGYSIPQGGMFRYVSCPNYLGELAEWVGWAIATWSVPGLSFAIWTAANLAPRARAHDRWYREHFADYPPARKALLPGLW